MFTAAILSFQVNLYRHIHGLLMLKKIQVTEEEAL